MRVCVSCVSVKTCQILSILAIPWAVHLNRFFSNNVLSIHCRLTQAYLSTTIYQAYQIQDWLGDFLFASGKENLRIFVGSMRKSDPGKQAAINLHQLEAPKNKPLFLLEQTDQRVLSLVFHVFTVFTKLPFIYGSSHTFSILVRLDPDSLGVASHQILTQRSGMSAHKQSCHNNPENLTNRCPTLMFVTLFSKGVYPNCEL